MTEEKKVKPRWLWKALKHIGIGGFLIAGVWASGQWLEEGRTWMFSQAAEAAQWMEKQVTREVVVREYVNPDTVPTEMLIEQVAAEEGLPVELLKAMVLKESGSFNRTNARRFEPHIFKKFNRTIPHDLNDIERQLWASSIGLMQVIWVYHFRTCGLEGKDPDALLDALTNLRCGAKVFKERWTRFRDVKNVQDRLFMSLRAYNGDVDMPETAYYAEHIMGNMLTMRTNEMLGRLK